MYVCMPVTMAFGGGGQAAGGTEFPSRTGVEKFNFVCGGRGMELLLIVNEHGR